MSTNRIVQLVALSCALVALLVAALFMVPRVKAQRAALQLGFAFKPDETMPADIAFASTMLGPLKGFMVNALWYRVEQLKQQGRFAEINELSRLITTLQPHFPEVWRFHAWNMAYNVSVQTDTPQERWDWVNKGVRLLREEGLRYNPRAVKIYRELTWIFFHKIGQYSDDAHWYYKVELCREWQEILGVITEGRDKAGAIAEFKKIADAHPTLDELLAAQPLVRELLDKHIIPARYDIEATLDTTRRAERERLLRAMGKVLIYNYTARLSELPFELRPMPQLDGALLPLFREPEYRPALEALMNHLRVRVIIDRYRMDPAVMLAIMEKFGPVDYRVASSQSLYWAYLGVQMMNERLNRDNVDHINTLRHQIHALQDLTDSGNLVFFPEPGSVDAMHDIRFGESYLLAVEEAEELLASVEQGDEKPYAAGHENFMLKMVVLYYQSGQKDMARKFREKAAQAYGKAEHNVRTGRYLLPLDEHFQVELNSLIENLESARAYIAAMVQNGLTELAFNNDTRQFDRYMKAARDAYDLLMKQSVATTLTEQDRMALAPGAMFNNNVLSLMRVRSPVEFRARIWRRLPVNHRQQMWDILASRLKADAEEVGLNPALVFPEPEGMEAWRRNNPGRTSPLPITPTTPGRGPLRE